MGFRYIGVKARLMDFLLAKMGEIIGPEGHVVDLMCGTGAVSAALRQSGYQVTANDIMTYSYHHARVLLLFSSSPCFAGASGFLEQHCSDIEMGLFPQTPYERVIQALNNVDPVEGYFHREFCADGRPTNTERPRNYYSPENAKRIDGMRLWVKRLREDGRLTDLEHSLLLHDLVMAANDVANIAGTYGHYLSRLIGRAKDKLILKPTPLLVMDDGGRHRVLKGYAEEIAGGIACDLCYIDPPYMKRQYAANYHVLETLAREDEPEAIGVSGLRPWRDQYSNFCTKTKIRDSFRRILSSTQCPHFLVSYSEDGLLKLNELEEVLSEFGVVSVDTLRYKRFRSNNSALSPTLTEYLLHLQRC